MLLVGRDALVRVKRTGTLGRGRLKDPRRHRTAEDPSYQQLVAHDEFNNSLRRANGRLPNAIIILS